MENILNLIKEWLPIVNTAGILAILILYINKIKDLHKATTDMKDAQIDLLSKQTPSFIHEQMEALKDLSEEEVIRLKDLLRIQEEETSKLKLASTESKEKMRILEEEKEKLALEIEKGNKLLEVSTAYAEVKMEIETEIDRNVANAETKIQRKNLSRRIAEKLNLTKRISSLFTLGFSANVESGEIAPQMVLLFNKAKQEIDIVTENGLSNIIAHKNGKDLIDAIRNALSRGVLIRVIQSGEIDQQIINLSREHSNLQVKHSKLRPATHFIIVDDKHLRIEKLHGRGSDELNYNAIRWVDSGVAKYLKESFEDKFVRPDYYD